MANQAPNTARAIEGAVVSALLVAVPLVQPTVDKLPYGPTIEAILGAIVVGVIAYIKSLANPGDTTGLVADLNTLADLVSQQGVTSNQAIVQAKVALSTATDANSVATQAQVHAASATVTAQTLHEKIASLTPSSLDTVPIAPAIDVEGMTQDIASAALVASEAKVLAAQAHAIATDAHTSALAATDKAAVAHEAATKAHSDARAAIGAFNQIVTAAKNPVVTVDAGGTAA